MVGGRDLLHEDKYVRIGSVQYVKDTIDMIAGLGGKILTVVPSTVGKIVPMGSPEDEWQWAVESLKECQAHAEKKGVRLALEPLNRFETYFLNRHDQALALAEDVGGDCGVCLDIFHMNIEEADWEQALRTAAAAGKLVDVHVADNNRMPCGQGAIDWGKFIGTLEEVGYDDYLTVEFVVPRRPQPHLRADRDRRRLRGGRERRARAVPARPRHRRGAGRALRPVRPGVDRRAPPAHRRPAGDARLAAWSLPSYNIADLAPPDIQAYLEEKDIVMVPIASMEQHGPHLPLATDTIQADEITRRAAERAQVLYTPCVWFGYSPQHMYEPGRRHRDDHRPVADPARGLPRRCPLAHPPRLQPARVRQQPRLERQDHRPAPAPHPLRDRGVRDALQALRRALPRA